VQKFKVEEINHEGYSRNITPAAPLAKYDVPSQRYTSYPTVPYWNEGGSADAAALAAARATGLPDNTSEGISLHLPFCEQLCT